jgi:hypothetical protein
MGTMRERRLHRWERGDGAAARWVVDPVAQLVRQESAGGIVLVATAGALVWANAAPVGYHGGSGNGSRRSAPAS